MDALNNDRIKVFFGGGYDERWSEDYSLSICYYERKYVEAEYSHGKWISVGGDAELVKRLRSSGRDELLSMYFQAAAEVYAAAHDCLKRGLSVERLGECYHNHDNPLAAPELMRLLMDDCGFSLEKAYCIAAYCCDALSFRGDWLGSLYTIQPRTAHVVSILRHTLETLPMLIHDSRKECFRSIPQAAETGSELKLSFLRKGGRISYARLDIIGDSYSRSYDMESDGDQYYVNLILPEEPQALCYYFYIETQFGAYWLCPDETGFIGRLYPRKNNGFRLTVYKRGFETPSWFRRSILYQIFPDRFAFSNDGTAERGIAYHESLGQTPELHKSLDELPRWQAREFEAEYSPDDFYGGTFRGIESKLPYLKALGVSCLYLNPIAEARSNHRYDTSDYTRPDPILGTVEDFEHLCSAAEETGIHIILDGVFSHTGCDSIYFDRYGHYGGNGAYSGTASPYYSWYDFKCFPEDYRCWWGFRDLPEVEEENSAWQKYIISDRQSIVKLWLRRGAAGWRLDVADELPDDVLELIRENVKSEKADAPIIGEVWEDAVIKESYGARRRYALGTALDSVMNYPLRTAVLDFIHGRSDAYALRDFLTAQQMNYPKPLYYSLMNLLGSHDVPRLRTALASPVDLHTLPREEQVKYSFSAEALEKALRLERICAALQFSLPGVPSIYYGDEQGMTGADDPFNRAPFAELESELHDYYASLAALRNSSSALSTGHAVFYAVCSDVLAVLRYTRNGKDIFGEDADNAVFLSVFNRSDTEKSFTVCDPILPNGSYSSVVNPFEGKIIKME